MQTYDLSTLLSAGKCLVDSTPSNSAPHLKAVLLSRLVEFNKCLGRVENLENVMTLDDAELRTAQGALYVVEHAQNILATDRNGGTEETPLLGTRDMAQLRTLLQIIVKWGIDILLPRVSSTWPGKSSQPSQSAGDTYTPRSAGDHANLCSITLRLVRLLFPGDRPLPQTFITITIVNRHLADVLRPCISIGWLPESFAPESTPTLDAIRPSVTRLLSLLSPSQTISALGSILSSNPPLPSHTRRVCASFLTQQLMRPEGIRGLCDAVFGDIDAVEVPLEKLEHVARVLSTVPAATKPEEYFGTISPRIIAMLSGNAPPSHKRAAAFALSRMLAPGNSFPRQALVSSIILPILHKTFLVPLDNLNSLSSAPSDIQYLSPRQSLSTLMTILTNSDPSPFLISTLLSPILSSLYAVLFYLDGMRTSDPQLKEDLRSILSTWGRVVSLQEAVSALWTILDNESGQWEVDDEGELKRRVGGQPSPSLSLLTPKDVRRLAEEDDDDFDLNLLDLRPDPVHFVQFIKSFDRPDIYSEIFVKLLEVYRRTKIQPDPDPLRTLLYLQLVMQMQSQLSDKNESSMLRKPDRILSFVKHVLESAVIAAPSPKPSHQGRSERLRREDLLIVPEDDRLVHEGDSDDETLDETATVDDDMTETAINLLLSILEANANISGNIAQALDDIFDLLEPISKKASHGVRLVAREALMVITARLASTSSSQTQTSKRPQEDGVQETYQKALKLIQDPILPVRAHGLLLLRQIITRGDHKDASQALVPAILSIFLQSIQDDDSYMFLNAVQGLAAMVDKFGKDVLKGLINVYSQGLNSSSFVELTQNEIDTRIRVGEALNQVIRRCGQALGIYVDILVPSLFNIVRGSSIPTVLRSSALSLLAECENTNSLSLLQYSGDLFETMIDLIQIETVPARPSSKVTSSTNEAQPTVTVEPQPTNSKLPPLRRAALHLLLRIIQQTTARAYESGLEDSKFRMKRARTIVAYAASTDEDAVVRVMAREVLEALDDLGQARRTSGAGML